MQIAQNNIAPPRSGYGQGVEALNKGQPEGLFDFRSMVDQQVFSPVLEGKSFLNSANAKRIDSGSAEHSMKAGDLKNKTSRSAEGSRDLTSERASGENRRDVAEDQSRMPDKPVRSREPKAKDIAKKNSVVQKFMASLESELGITAERFSAALAQLPPEVKALPVQESASFVIEKLGIPIDQQQTATDAYVNLLETSGINNVGNRQGLEGVGAVGEYEKFSMAADSNNSDKGFEIGNFMTAEMRKNMKLNDRQKLNSTIDEMNKRFFDISRGLPIETPSIESNPVLDSENTMGIVSKSWEKNRFDQNVNQPDIPSLSDQLSSTMSLNEIERFELNPEDLEEPLLDEAKLNFASIGDGDIQAQKLNGTKSWSVEELPFLVKTDAIDSTSPTQLGLGDALGSEFNRGNFDSTNLKQGSSDEFSRGGESTDGKTSPLYGGSDGFQNQSIKNANMPKGAGITQSLATEQRIANINKISNATEALAAKGGGEVKVVLAPEGLGTVQLKVKMQDGKLQVEMKAENLDSKQLLENSLNELKQSLSSHRLSVDSVKVDVAGDFNRQDSSQSFTQQQFDLGRDQARQFMNQFREGNLSQRQAFFEAPGFKNYRSQREDALSPISTDIRPRASLSANKGREINLVA